jgi:type IV pilus biogenesis protein PilP
LLTKADPSLANIKPKRRPSNLSIPVVAKLPEKIDPSEIAVAVQQAVLDVARPKARPRNLKRIVARTKAAEKTNQQNVQTASLTPATAVNTSKPSAPTAVNVQKEATERSGFSKRRMSLIGVYGSSSNRRALVRLPSGRYVKVKPGQKLSGWKVSAIGESSIRITKGNRNEVLRLPK